MTLIIETGEGVSGANSYVGLAYASEYLQTRNKATAWAAASLAARQAALIEATTYIDLTFGPKFLGSKEFLELDQFARNFLSLESQPVNPDTITIGSQTYLFVVADATSANEIKIGASIAETLQNIVYAINASGGTEGVDWGTGTTANADVTAQVSSSDTEVIFTAKTAGTDGNSIAATTNNSDVIKIDTATFTGGSEPKPQPLEFPRLRLYDRSGVLVDGIPEKLKMATVEYADRQLDAALLPDPEYDSSGRIITRKLEKVGPIEEEIEYVPAALIITRKYPLADRMIREYMVGGGQGGVYR